MREDLGVTGADGPCSSCSFVSLSDFEHTSQKRSRCVQTIHGDFNTGNVWKNKEEPSKHCVADWQGLRKGPAGSDWGTFIGTLDRKCSRSLCVCL